MRADGPQAIIIGPMFRSVRELKALLGRARASQRSRQEFVIAVDRGLDWALKAGLNVNVAIGDWDSLRQRGALRGIRHITLPIGKDRSDFYYGLGLAVNAGASRILCLGFSGGLQDHALAVFLDLTSITPSEQVREIRMLSEESDIFVLSGAVRRWSGSLRKSQRISLFSLGGDAQGVVTEGLEFPLKKDLLPPSSRGLSNRALRSKCTVSVRKGSLLIVIPRLGKGPGTEGAAQR